MRSLALQQVQHQVKVGDICPAIDPNTTEDTLFTIDGKPVGFYIKSISPKAQQYLEIANNEFLSTNVPKDMLRRASEIKAQNFIKAMLLLAFETEKLIKEYMPEQYETQLKIIQENVPEKWRFGNLFTSSISNFNIAADYHRDTRNLKPTVNAIFTKRNNSTGGSLNVPDYDITVEQADNSLLVYPAWANLHGVTPIETSDYKNGYRNSFIFYPLTGFEKL